MAQVATYRARNSPLDHTRLLTDPKVQDWAAISGTRRSLATNVPDGGPRVNVNLLKYKRDADFTSTTPYDGGPSYNPETCVQNWAEDRRDKNYKSGFHPKEVRRPSGRYDSEYAARFRPSGAEYLGRLTHTYNTTSRFEGLARVQTNGIVTPVLPKRSADTSGEHVFYAKDGFGPTQWMDHTAPAARGKFWVGTAPHVAHDSITHSTLRSEPLEFQQRCPMEDARSKILMGNKSLIHESDRTLRIRDELIATSRTFASTWRSIYQSEHVDFSHRPATVR
ncbi:hypothetical protein HYH02_007897 [Chlamydomonas schloesseri]|uniref:Uncharacterized protein n=1 Tax=Chlamydomonas schloesseri TaxID=2026947 RepID=A0A835WHA4_9CHLO|nr:hypothetical protein HYH02_007897 [Chlamydomonas schloesseri]|eukprot:KAG2447151.1 hypothetical protein HYH02_007897 [Chlamydomonas schloesseri]